mgnify:CR=1 FL=1
MISALFIYSGIQELRAPEGHAQAAKPVLDAVAPAIDKAVEAAPVDQRPPDEALVKLDAAVKIAAGSMLALGRFPRLAATALAASLVPTTLAGHRFWEETDEGAKQQQTIHFLKNLGLLGGLLIAAADTEGKPSLGWRGRRAARLATAAAAAQADSITGTISGAADKVAGVAHDVGGKLSGTARDTGGKLSGSARDAGGTVAGLAAGLAGLAPGAGAAVSSRVSRAGSEVSSRVDELTADWAKRAAKARRRAEKRSAKLQKRASRRGAELQRRAAKRAGQLQKAAERRRAELGRRGPTPAEQAAKLGHDLAGRVSAIGHEVAHQAEGAAKDARKRVAALTS